MDDKRSMLRHVAASNLVTYVSLGAALLALHFAALGRFHLTAALWTLSALCDNFDGAFASLFRRDELDREFGRALDSLVDCLAFGVVPVACLRMLAFPAGALLQAAFAAGCLLYILAVVTRLGHFDCMARRGARGFTGLPTTEAVLVLATVFVFPFPREHAWSILVVLGALMVAPLRVNSPRGAGKVLLILWLVAVGGAHVWRHLSSGG